VRAVENEALTESAVARDVLVASGISADRIELDERSRNTCENATESVLLAKPRPGERWLLVTPAVQMPRSVACFRAAGFAVISYPVDYRTRRALRWPGLAASIATGLGATDFAAHESIGLLAHRALGLTNELLPSPAEGIR
jgi:uncharacterized SAM-binding protein YcdF (DUF218 family)